LHGGGGERSPASGPRGPWQTEFSASSRSPSWPPIHTPPGRVYV